MRIGTPGFIAGRLTEGREARGLSQTSLSELTGIKAQSISHYEQGRQSPSPEALALLCESLHLPERFFLRPASGSNNGPVFFRAAGVSARHARIKQARRLGWMEDIAVYLRRYVDMPSPRFPVHTVPPSADPASVGIDRIADEIRGAFRLGFGPLGNLTAFLEEMGCFVSRSHMDPELGGSCSKHNAGVSCMVLRADDSRPTWARFHAAHELGHIVMHGQLRNESLADPETHRILELQADRFARAFLLPERLFAREVWAPNIDALLTMKKEWRAPVSVMVARCGEIGVFDADQVRRALINVVRRGWKVTEPRENTVEAEKPGLLAQSIRLLIDEGPKDAHGVLTDLGLAAADVEELTGLPGGYFASREAPSPAALRLRSADCSERIHSL